MGSVTPDRPQNERTIMPRPTFPRIDQVCQHCGKTFQVRRGVLRKYCCQRCSWDARPKTAQNEEFAKLGRWPRNHKLNMMQPGKWEKEQPRHEVDEDAVKRFDERYNGCSLY
jgi:hypothetical protein